MREWYPLEPEVQEQLDIALRAFDLGIGGSEEPRQRESSQSRILVRTYDWLLQKFRMGPPGIQAHLPSEYRRAERTASTDAMYVGVDFDALLEEADEVELDAILDED